MKKPEKLILTIKETRVYEVEVSEEMGYDAFPDDLLGMVDYVNSIKDNTSIYIDGGLEAVDNEVVLVSIEER